MVLCVIILVYKYHTILNTQYKINQRSIYWINMLILGWYSDDNNEIIDYKAVLKGTF